MGSCNQSSCLIMINCHTRYDYLEFLGYGMARHNDSSSLMMGHYIGSWVLDPKYKLLGLLQNGQF